MTGIADCLPSVASAKEGGFPPSLKLRRTGRIADLRTVHNEVHAVHGVHSAAEPQPKEVKLRSARKEDSPPLQRWVIAQENKASPVRDERSVVPGGTCRAYLAGVPSHKWLGYFHKIFAKRGDSDGLQHRVHGVHIQDGSRFRIGTSLSSFASVKSKPIQPNRA